MIVVVGRPGIGVPDPAAPVRLEGLAARVALEVARAGAPVELVGSVGEDEAGDRVTVELGRAGVGHAALLRDPAGRTRTSGAGGPLPRLDARDLELGLGYVAECRVIVVAEPVSTEAAAAIMDAADYHSAAVVAVSNPGAAIPPAWERGATVFAAPVVEDATDDAVEGSRFAPVRARYALAQARGGGPEAALDRGAAGAGWERTDPS
jgi:hypothetical protein